MEHLNRKQLISLLRETIAHRERDHVLFLVTFYHGLRASEAVSLTPASFSGGYITVQRLKGSLKTTQPLVDSPDPLLDEKGAISRWLGKHVGDGRLFPISRIQFYRLIRSYGARAGIPAHLLHPHILKHSIAMQTIRQLGIENVRQLLGHKSIASTGAYLRVDDETATRLMMAALRSQAEE